MIQLKFSLKSAGYCEAKQSHVLSGSANKVVKFRASYGHIEHPVHGHILFDTGYTRRFYSATKNFPLNIYAYLTKVFIRVEEEASTALSNIGIVPEEVRFIIVSHFHADHIGGLRDFPNARFICTKEAFVAVEHKKGFAALTRGYLSSLLPNDFRGRTDFLELEQATRKDEHLGKLYDLFGDGSILICQLEGHAKGQIGALLETEIGKVFMISDAAWLKQNFQDFHLPSPMVRLFIDSWKNFIQSLKRIHAYHQSNPETIIIPCHCEETYEKLTNSSLGKEVLSPPND
ncbi:MAG: MBL fold metallo-hydrolase [Saprospiraceae bacterium]